MKPKPAAPQLPGGSGGKPAEFGSFSPIRLLIQVILYVVACQLAILIFLAIFPQMPFWLLGLSDLILLAGVLAVALRRVILKPIEHLGLDAKQVASSTLDQLNEALLILNQSGQVYFANHAAENVLHLARQRMIGQPIGAILAAVSANMTEPKFLEWLQNAAMRPEEATRDLTGKREGRLFCAELTAHRILALGQQFTALMVFDATERRLEAEKHRRAESNLASIVEAAPEAILCVDDSGRVMLFNPGAELMFGVAAADAIGAPVFNLLPNLQVAGRPLTAGHSPRDYVSLTARRASQEEFPAELSIARVTAHGRAWTNVIVRDATERERALKEARQAGEQAQTTMRTKSQVLGSIGREVRTPLSSLVGSINLLQASELTPKQRYYANTAQNSADALLGCINDMMDLASIESGKLTLENADFEIRTVAERAITQIAGRAEKAGLQVSFKVMPEVPIALRGDQHRLGRILGNLLSNAVKYTEKGSVSLKVECLDQGGTGPKLRFTVRDSGVGIAVEKQATLFESNPLSAAVANRNPEGGGLGLAICKHLVDKMGGRIGVQSNPGQGSSFWFEVRFGHGETPAPVIDGAEVQLTGVRVLLVTQNTADQIRWQEICLGMGMRAVAVGDGFGAIGLLQEAVTDADSFPIVISELEMPEMDGLLLAKVIHSDSALGRTQVIMVVSPGKELTPETLRDGGVLTVIEKPLREEKLRQAIVSVLPATAPKPKPAPVSTPPKTAAPAPVSNLRILLAEDNPVNREVALGQLKHLGYSADVAPNGLVAVQKVQERPYELVLMDCQMPELDGFAATGRIRELERAGKIARITIIALTANAMESDRQACLAAGMDDYLTKPIRMDELRKRLAEIGKKDGTPAPAMATAAPAPARPVTPVSDAPVAPAAPVPAAEEKPLVDMERLTEVSLDDMLRMKKLVGMYFADADNVIRDLTAAAAEGNKERMLALAHKGAGSSGSLGMMAMSEVMRKAEHHAREGEVAEARIWVAKAATLLGETRAWLAAKQLI